MGCCCSTNQESSQQENAASLVTDFQGSPLPFGTRRLVLPQAGWMRLYARRSTSRTGVIHIVGLSERPRGVAARRKKGSGLKAAIKGTDDSWHFAISPPMSQSSVTGLNRSFAPDSSSPTTLFGDRDTRRQTVHFCPGGPEVDFEKFDLRIRQVRKHCHRIVWDRGSVIAIDPGAISEGASCVRLSPP